MEFFSNFTLRFRINVIDCNMYGSAAIVIFRRRNGKRQSGTSAALCVDLRHAHQQVKGQMAAAVLALPVRWSDGRFYFESLNPKAVLVVEPVSDVLEDMASAEADKEIAADSDELSDFDPSHAAVGKNALNAASKYAGELRQSLASRCERKARITLCRMAVLLLFTIRRFTLAVTPSWG
jgi:hypothetical protein